MELIYPLPQHRGRSNDNDGLVEHLGVVEGSNKRNELDCGHPSVDTAQNVGAGDFTCLSQSHFVANNAAHFLLVQFR